MTDDYTSATFGANAATADVFVYTVNDNVVKGDETAEFALASVSGYSIGSPDDATLTLTDDPPLIIVAAIADRRSGGIASHRSAGMDGGRVMPEDGPGRPSRQAEPARV